MKKFVKDLKVGDVLASTGAKVIREPQSGVKTPTGKSELIIETLNGEKLAKEWNSSNKVLIK